MLVDTVMSPVLAFSDKPAGLELNVPLPLVVQVMEVALPLMVPAKGYALAWHIAPSVPALVIAAGLIVIVSLSVAAAQPPAAAMLFVIVYVPAVDPARSISPVFTFTNTRPAVELNTPPLDPAGNVGNGFTSDEQNGVA